jgi:CBS domain-containing protein
MVKRRVGELMNPDVVCARPEMTVAEVGKLLALRGVSGAPVVDDQGRILGIVSQNDLVRHSSVSVTAEESGRFYSSDPDYRDIGALQVDLSDTPITEVMSKQVHTVSRETSAAIAANIMRERRIHRLVVTERARVVGVIASLDLMRVVEETC